MRQERTVQASIFDLFAQHEIGCELKKASTWLDEHPTLLGLVAADLRRDGVQETGRHGLPAEAVLRCALLKQSRQLSYEKLAFHLEDSASFRAFVVDRVQMVGLGLSVAELDEVDVPAFAVNVTVQFGTPVESAKP